VIADLEKMAARTKSQDKDLKKAREIKDKNGL
jgi:hypothetical protein